MKEKVIELQILWQIVQVLAQLKFKCEIFDSFTEQTAVTREKLRWCPHTAATSWFFYWICLKLILIILILI